LPLGSGSSVHAGGGAVEVLVDGGEEVAVAVLMVAFEGFAVARELRQERADDGGVVEVGGEAAVAEVLEVAGVHDLLELAAEGDGEHRLLQVDGLAHQSEASARDDP